MARTRQDGLAKSERFQVRATPRQASLIRAGAARRKVNLTDYIVESTCAQAEMELVDENHFVLKDDRWKAFLEALDEPPKVPEGLARLFSGDSVAESR
jgi:uncharacterized protein (DUF1778 family)